MLTKENFVKIINNIKEQEKKINKFSSALEEMSDGYVVFDSDNKYLQSLLAVLREEFSDEDDYIGWWLYEDVEKKIWDREEIDVSTPELLYDFLVANQTRYWHKVGGIITPGGDPGYECPVCHDEKSFHLHGIESRKEWNYCPCCGTKLKYL